jgi:hypothetical protein
MKNIEKVNRNLIRENIEKNYKNVIGEKEKK